MKKQKKIKKRWLVPLIWGVLAVLTLILGWISFFIFQTVPDILITVVCGSEGLAITFTGILGIVETITNKDEKEKE